MVQVGDACPYRIKSFEGADECAGWKNLYLYTPAGRLTDGLSEP
jgi:hypothetical protein